MSRHRARRPRIALATDADREEIYRIRHEVYATELGQHAENVEGMLRDALDEVNTYVIVALGTEIVGFVAITPPNAPSYSIDKYLSRDELPFQFNDGLYEVRLLTVRKPYRGLPVAGPLLLAAFRWVEAHGGQRIVAMGRQEVLPMYAKVGTRMLGRKIQAGAVQYELMSATVDEYRAHLAQHPQILDRIERRVDWQLDVPLRPVAPCFHGGAFFEAVGDTFDDLGRRHGIINADVLDAWFPPSPAAIQAITDNLPWLARTSPPTHSAGLIRTIADVRAIDPACVLPGAGSSSLIYLAFREWLSPASRVLILDPTYGEYTHVLKHVVGCQVERLELSQNDGYALNPQTLADRLRASRPYDLVALVNPNSPTGCHVQRAAMEAALNQAPRSTRIWIDETYVEYAGPDQSLEQFAAQSANVVVCKSMSKVYALSGLRVAYLCGSPAMLQRLRILTPPWAVSLLAQVAAVEALSDPDYYQACYRRTRDYRAALAADLAALAGVRVMPSITNFLLFHLPETGPDAATIVRRCRRRGLFLRDASVMGTTLGRHALRTAVKTPEINRQIVSILGDSMRPSEPAMA